MKKSELFKDGMKKTGSFARGFTSTFTSLNLLTKHKGLIGYFIVPFLINIIVLGALFYFSYYNIKPWLYGMLEGSGWFYDLLRMVLAPLLFMVLGIITVLLYSITGSIITAPFNDYLSYSVEVREAGLTFDEPFSVKVLVADIVRITLNIFKMLILLLIINISLLVVNMVPLVGTVVYSAVSFLSTTFFLGFQFFDFPLERRRFDFKQKLQIAWHHKFLTIGLGTGFMVVTFIPVLGFLGLNMATMGATQLFLEHIRPTLKLTENEQAVNPGTSLIS